MTLSDIVVWFAERSQNQHKGRALRNAGMKRWQLEQLEQLGIISRNGDMYYLLDYVKYQPNRRVAA